MSRINYTEDEDFPGQFELWQANCDRSLKGRKGQRELQVLREALLALPVKHLAHGVLETADGEMCAIGAYAKHKGLDLSHFDPDYASDEVGKAVGMPPLVAWKVVEMNDEWFGHEFTPEQRYKKMLAWVESLLTEGVK